MDIIEYFINEVNKSKIDSGPIQAIHYDLHFCLIDYGLQIMSTAFSFEKPKVQKNW